MATLIKNFVYLQRISKEVIMKVKKISYLLLTLLFSMVTNAQVNHWSVNANDYQYDMSVYAKFVLNDKLVEDYSKYQVAAFVDNECRGVSAVQEKNGERWLYLRLRSNKKEGEVVRFMIYDNSSGKVDRLSNKINFLFQSVSGMPGFPLTLTLSTSIIGDVTGDGIVTVADIMSLANYIIGKKEVGFVEDSADTNRDGVVNMADCTTLVDMIFNKKK